MVALKSIEKWGSWIYNARPPDVFNDLLSMKLDAGLAPLVLWRTILALSAWPVVSRT